MATQLNEQLLDEKLEQLEKARAWSPRVVSKLEAMIRGADDYAVFRINPYQYAAEKNMTVNEVIDLFLYSTKFGLFEMEWHLICRSCGHVVESFRELTNLHTHFVCVSCTVESDVSLDDFIEISFTISPQIRKITYHDPKTLSAEDLYLRYYMTKAIALAPEAQDYVALLQQGTRLMRSLAPHEKLALEFDLYPSVLQIKDRNRFEQIIFLATEAPSDTLQVVPIILENDEMRVERHVVGSLELQFDVKRTIKKAGQLSPGKVQIELENRMAIPIPIWILVTSFKSWDVHFGPFLNGKKLLTTQTFRDLFRYETVQTSEGIGVKDITFLFTDLKGSTAMYDEIGDPKAYYLVRQHFDALGKVVAHNNGAIVKTIGDAIMATFMTPADALKAAIEMLKAIDEFNRSISQNLYLKVGIHRGHSIAVTLNERLDYFGQTVNIAARVQGLADADEIYVTQEIYDMLGQSDALTNCHVTPEQVAVKGVSDKLSVYKITL